MRMRQHNILPTQFVALVIIVVSTVLSMLLTTTISSSSSVVVTDHHNNQQIHFYIHAFHLVPSVSYKNDHSVVYRRRDYCDEDRYLGMVTTTTSSSSKLDATTRRQSFGDLLGSTLALPAIVDTVTTIQPTLSANAADDYPFKVRTNI